MRHPTERLTSLAERTAGHQTGSRTELTGQVPGTPGPVTIYTNGSVSQTAAARNLGRLTGWGYLATDGTWGCGKSPQFAHAGTSLPLVTELRAVWHAIGTRLAAGPCTIVTTSRHAAAILTAWKSGSTDMPPGYRGSRRRRPTLERLRHEIDAHPGNLTVRLADGPADAVLHDGADTLALIGLRWARDGLTADETRRRAAGTATDFLAQWRTM